MMTFFRLLFQILSTLEAVDQQVSELLESLTHQLGTYDRFTLELTLREALNNAVIHGNLNQAEHLIFCSIILVGDWFHIRIEDQGVGNDWTTRVSESPRPEDEHGRGLPIIMQYGESVALNHRGNHISFKIARYQ